MNLMRVIAALIFCLFVFSFSLNASSNQNLCTEHEDALFTCTLESKKLVSVCGLVDFTEKSGYKRLAYRYGTKQEIEMSLPNKRLDFRRISSAIELTDDKTMEDDQFIRFKNGKYSYIVYSADGRNFQITGLAVFEGYKLLSNAKCLPDTTDLNLQQNFLLNIGVPLQDDTEAMQFWKALLPSSSAILSQRKPNMPQQ